MGKSSPMVRLTKDQIRQKVNFVWDYTNATNAATGAVLDANANVDQKNISTLHSELNKDINIQVNRQVMYDEITRLFGKELADEYLRQLEAHEIYAHDETTLYPYCASISMYPFLKNGTRDLGGESLAPKHFESYCGSFINMLYAISSQLAGACLAGDQRLILWDEFTKSVSAPRIKDFVQSHTLLNSFVNWQGEWEFAETSDVFVWEHGKYVPVKKVYRRKYDSDIYTIKTASGKKVRCSEDHIFKVMFRGRAVNVRASDLKLYDTVFNTANDFSVDTDSSDFVSGQFIGIIASSGKIVNDNTIQIVVDHDDKFIFSFLDKAFLELHNDVAVISNKRVGFCHYEISSIELVHKIRGFLNEDDLGIHGINHIDDFSLEFLLGYFDGVTVTHGYWDKHHVLQVTDSVLADNVREILEMIGVHVGVDEIPDPDNKRFVYKICFKNQVNKYLPLTVQRWSSCKRFLKTSKEEESYCGKNAFRRFCGDSKNGYVTYSGDRREGISDFYDVIVSIEKEDCTDGYVYEIETETHWYSAGGILTHNCATVEFLMHMDYFARKDFGENYLETHERDINDGLQHVVYSLNQPAAARGYQAVFWNISVFDRPYFESIFEGFVYPGTDDRPDYDSIARLQRFFLHWFNKERERSLLTFPVVTAAILSKPDRSGFVDPETVDFLCKELAEGNSFFIYQSDSADSLSSCCRLKNALVDKPEFSYTLGAGGVSTGSVNVISLNISRLVQDGRDIRKEVRKIHKYQIAYRSIIERFLKAKMLPVYDAGCISLNKQYSTVGIIGLAEAAEYSGLEISNNDSYKNFLVSILKPIYEENRKASKEFGVMFNTEMVPGESLGVKFARWDKEDMYFVPRDCYNSYFYLVEDPTTDIYDKFRLHGEEVVSYLDGGSALHLNLEEHLTPEGYKKLMLLAVRTGCNYWTTNVRATCCEDCGHIDKHTLTSCPLCGSENISHATRIIGYLKKISAFSEDRQKEHARRAYHATIKAI